MADDDVISTYPLGTELQRSIIYNCLTNRQFFVETSPLIQPEFFTDAAHGLIYRLAREFFAGKYSGAITDDGSDMRSGSMITRSVLEHLTGTEIGADPSEYSRVLGELDEVYANGHAHERERDFLMDKTTRFARHQALRGAILKSVEHLNTGNYDQIEVAVREALLVGPSPDMGAFYFEDAEARYDLLEEQAESGTDRFTCVFGTVDRDLRGGIGRKEIALIFSGPGIGKSIYLANFARSNVLLGRRVLYVTLENSALMSQERFDASFTGVPAARLLAERDGVMEALRQVGAVHPRSLIVKEWPNQVLTVPALRSYMSQLWVYYQWRPDVIVLDYLDEMAPVDKNDEYQNQMKITRQLRALAVQENLAICSATQSNRAGRQVKTATETEMGDSFGKVRVVDALWSLNQTDEERSRWLARLFTVKHRNGRARYHINIHIDYDTLVMREVSDDDYQRMMAGSPVGVGNGADTNGGAPPAFTGSDAPPPPLAA